MQHCYFVIYKPASYLSQFTDPAPGAAPKLLLGELYDFPTGTLVVDPLDEQSEGLLLLTTDDQISGLLRRTNTVQEYTIQVAGLLDASALTRLQAVVDRENYQSPWLVRQRVVGPYFVPRANPLNYTHSEPTSWVSVTCTEGDCRRLRTLTTAADLLPLRLLRERIGDVHLGNLSPGAVVEVDDFIFWPNNVLKAHMYKPD
jgi:23S rRNA pseudouridine2457 synthase